jgi:hypothetical protein
MSSRTFESWMAAVDAAVSQIAFVSVHDLPDIDFRSLYEAGESPQTAAHEALEYADYPLDELGFGDEFDELDW